MKKCLMLTQRVILLIAFTGLVTAEEINHSAHVESAAAAIEKKTAALYPGVFAGNTHSLRKISSSHHDTMEVILQEKTGGEWENQQRILIMAGTEFRSVENFIDSLLNVGNLAQDAIFSILDQPFEAGFYMLTQTWVPGDEWVNEFRMTSTADGEGRIATLSMQNWTNSWQEGLLLEYSYDDQSRLDQIIIKVSNNGSSLENTMRMTRTYSDDGRPELDMIAFYADDSWINQLRVSYTYDAEGNLTVRLSETNLQIQWAATGRVTMTYNANQNLIEKVTETSEGDGFTGQIVLVNSQKELFSYDADYNRTEHLYQNYKSESWQDSLRKTYDYNDQNMNTLMQTEIMSGGSWENESRTQISYQEGKVNEELYQEWESGAWVNIERTTTSYDSEDRPVLMVLFDWSGSAWVESEQYIMNYEEYTPVASQASVVSEQFSLSNYPNPFNPVTMIRVHLPDRETISLHMLDVRGRIVKTLIRNEVHASGFHSFQWHGRDDEGRLMPSGMYLIRLESETHRQVTKRCLLIK